MRLHERIRQMIEALPDSASVTLDVETLKGWLHDEPDGIERDLTVDDVAAFFRRSPTTVRAWCRTGTLPAYKLNGGEYRITAHSVKEYQNRQRRNGCGT